MRHTHLTIRLHTAHRRSDAARMVASLIEHEQIRTTLTKARTAHRVADHMIRLGKIGTLASRRQASAFMGDGPALDKLFAEIAKRYQTRPGGFTRLIRDVPRKGDGSPMAVLELVDRVAKPVTTQKVTGKEKKKAQELAPAKKATAAAEVKK